MGKRKNKIRASYLKQRQQFVPKLRSIPENLECIQSRGCAIDPLTNQVGKRAHLTSRATKEIIRECLKYYKKDLDELTSEDIRKIFDEAGQLCFIIARSQFHFAQLSFPAKLKSSVDGTMIAPSPYFS